MAPLPTPTAGTWATIPGTILYPAIPFEAKGESAPGGVPELWSPQSLFAYSGAALAQRAGVWGFLIWGGGHAATADNSLYWLPFDGSAGERLMGPYLAPDKVYLYDVPTETYRDVSRNVTGVTLPGAPKSRHTYSSLVWTGPEILAFGGALHTGGGGGTDTIRRFDLGQTYSQAMARPDMGWRLSAPAPAGTVTCAAGWDAQTGKYVVRARSFFGAYVPATNTWERWGDAGGGSDYAAGVAMDVRGRRMYVLGDRLAEVIDLNARTLTPIMAAWADPFRVAFGGPGVGWHAGSRQIVAWLQQSQDLLLIDPLAATSRTVAMQGVTLSAMESSGTFGRFGVIPGTDQVVLVNRVTEEVFIGTVPYGPWREHPLPAAGLAYMAGSGGKHGRTVYHPGLRQMVFAGGDWHTSQPQWENGAFTGSEVWALDVASDRWTLLRPFCVPGQPQPGRPDNVVWALDRRRNQAIMAPGFYGITQGSTSGCGAVEGWGSYVFDFATNQFRGPDTVIPLPPDGWGGDSNSAFAVYDPVTDELVRPRLTGGWGFQIERFNLGTRTWRVWLVPGAARNFLSVHREQPAFDPRDGVLYFADRDRRVLWIVNHRQQTVTSSPLPAEWLSLLDTGTENFACWDPVHRVVLLPNNRDFATSSIIGLAIFSPDTGTWQWQSVPPMVWGSVWGFDEATGQLIGIGKRTIPTAYYTYRFELAPSETPTYRIAATLAVSVT